MGSVFVRNSIGTAIYWYINVAESALERPLGPAERNVYCSRGKSGYTSSQGAKGPLKQIEGQN
jgi:hypothetical protein